MSALAVNVMNDLHQQPDNLGFPDPDKLMARSRLRFIKQAEEPARMGYRRHLASGGKRTSRQTGRLA